MSLQRQRPHSLPSNHQKQLLSDAVIMELSTPRLNGANHQTIDSWTLHNQYYIFIVPFLLDIVEYFCRFLLISGLYDSVGWEELLRLPLGLKKHFMQNHFAPWVMSKTGNNRLAITWKWNTKRLPFIPIWIMKMSMQYPSCDIMGSYNCAVSSHPAGPSPILLKLERCI